MSQQPPKPVPSLNEVNRFIRLSLAVAALTSPHNIQPADVVDETAEAIQLQRELDTLADSLGLSL